MKISSMDYIKAKKDIKTIKGLADQNADVWNYVQKPIGKALYEHYNDEIEDEPIQQKDNDEEVKIPKWKEKLQCKICKGIYQRSNYSKHKQTKVHQAYEKINKKLRKIMLENN
jgi:hypothetical protein